MFCEYVHVSFLHLGFMFDIQGDKGEPAVALLDDGSMISGPTGPRGVKVL